MAYVIKNNRKHTQQGQLLFPSCAYMVKEHSLIVHGQDTNLVSMEILSMNVVCAIVLCYV